MTITTKAVVLAAGQSSRFWPLAVDQHKSSYEIIGKPVIQYTIEALIRCGITDVAIIQSGNDSSIQDRLIQDRLGHANLSANIEYLTQKTPKGMGDAILQAKDWIGEYSFVVTNADQVNADELLPPMFDKLQWSGCRAALSAQETDTPWNYGILGLNRDRVKRIVEKPAKGEEPSNLMVIGVYLLPSDFLPILARQAHDHYSFENAIQEHIDAYDATTSVIYPPDTPEITLKFPWHLFRLNRYLITRFLKGKNIHPDAILSPHSLVHGDVWIGAGVRMFENAVVKGPAYISKGAILGNNSLVRDYSYIGKNTIVGFGTEIKHSILYDQIETHANYIGDSIVDSGCGFGAGTVTANRRLDRANILSRVKGKRIDSGMSFFGTVIGKDVKTGIQSGIMPGVKIGQKCRIGANTMVTKDLSDSHLYYDKSNVVTRPI